MSVFTEQYPRHAQDIARIESILTKHLLPHDPSQHWHRDAVLTMPFTPPGMPHLYDRIEKDHLVDWLIHTVTDYTFTILELYPLKEAGGYFVMGRLEADVCWDQVPGHFESKAPVHIVLEDGMVRSMTIALNPMSFMEAAHMNVPVFPVNWHHPSVDAYMHAHGLDNPRELRREDAMTAFTADDTQPDLSPEAVAARKKACIAVYDGSVNYADALKSAAYTPDKIREVYFMPLGFKDYYGPEDIPRIGSWSDLSYRDLTFAPDSTLWMSENEDVCLLSASCTGRGAWPGLDYEARYYNRYLFVMYFDEAGRVCRDIEIMDPINLYHAAGIRLPSFPYGFYRL